jgi:hypothetical protein
MLRGAALLALTGEEVTDPTGEVGEQCALGPQQTGKGTVVALLPYRRQGLRPWRRLGLSGCGSPCSVWAPSPSLLPSQRACASPWRPLGE